MSEKGKKENFSKFYQLSGKKWLNYYSYEKLTEEYQKKKIPNGKVLSQEFEIVQDLLEDGDLRDPWIKSIIIIFEVLDEMKNPDKNKILNLFNLLQEYQIKVDRVFKNWSYWLKHETKWISYMLNVCSHLLLNPISRRILKEIQ